MGPHRTELEPGEHVVGEFRAHWRHALLPTGLIGVGAGIIAGGGPFRAALGAVMSGLVGLIATIAGIALLVDWFTQRAIVTTKRVIDRGGVIGTSIGAIPIVDITTAAARTRSTLDRLLRSPVVEIETDDELMWFSVEHPRDMASDIMAMVRVGRTQRPTAA